MISFGPFSLTPAKRLLERDGTAIRLGGRALDILVMLLEHAGETVSKHDLMMRVWPNVVVDEGSLRFHMTALRRALGDSKSGNRYIVNVPRQGYCFVAPINIPLESQTDRVDQRLQSASKNLPEPTARMIGRDETVLSIVKQLLISRFVTIAGAGGIGKTTVALAVAHALHDEFDGAIHFVGLGHVGDPQLVVPTITSALGLRLEDEDPTSTLIEYLRPRRMLLVIDCCEHVVDTVAMLAEKFFKEARPVYLLTTSRETLRVQGESVCRLGPLETPPENPLLSASEALSFSAVQLFVDRVAANLPNFMLTDTDAPIVAEICRRLDGIALAIELAAGRVEAFGIQGTASLLEQQIKFYWLGQRTALPRHQTLKATLDWSYNLLNDTDRKVLAILSVFSGSFTLEAIHAVADETVTERSDLIDSIASLVSKSLLTSRAVSGSITYRMLDTTKSFASEKREQIRDAEKILPRLVDYLILLGKRQTLGQVNSEAAELSYRKDILGDIRECLKWALTEHGDVRKGISLFLASCSIFPLLSLVPYWLDWADEAIAALPQQDVGSPIEFALQIALAMLSMFTTRALGAGSRALQRAATIAGELGDPQMEFASARYLFFFLVGQTGDFHEALKLAYRIAKLSENLGPSCIEEANDHLAMALYLTGDLERAEFAARRSASAQSPHVVDIRYSDERRPAVNSLVLMHVLWLRGYPDQAAEIASRLLELVIGSKDPFLKSIQLTNLSSLFMRLGDYDVAEECIDLNLTTTADLAATQFHNIALGFKGELAIRRGNISSGIALLQNSLPVEVLQDHSRALYGALALGLAKAARFKEALEAIEQAASWMKEKGAETQLTELLRTRADVMMMMPEPDLAAAESLLSQVIRMAQMQSSLSWELRAAMSIASLSCMRGEHQEGRDLLWDVYARFNEGLNSRDLRTAREMLAAMDSQIASEKLY